MDIAWHGGCIDFKTSIGLGQAAIHVTYISGYTILMIIPTHVLIDLSDDACIWFVWPRFGAMTEYKLVNRVIIKQNSVRFSVGLSCYIEGLITIPNEFIDKDHPIQYKPYHHLDYLKYFLEQYRTSGVLGSIKEYCGV